MPQTEAARRRVPVQTIVTAGVALVAIVVAIVLAVTLATNNASASRDLRAAEAKASELRLRVSECEAITTAMSNAITDMSQANAVYSAAAIAGDVSELPDGRSHEAAALAALQSVKVNDCR